MRCAVMPHVASFRGHCRRIGQMRHPQETPPDTLSWPSATANTTLFALLSSPTSPTAQRIKSSAHYSNGVKTPRTLHHLITLCCSNALPAHHAPAVFEACSHMFTLKSSRGMSTYVPLLPLLTRLGPAAMAFEVLGGRRSPRCCTITLLLVPSHTRAAGRA